MSQQQLPIKNLPLPINEWRRNEITVNFDTHLQNSFPVYDKQFSKRRFF